MAEGFLGGIGDFFTGGGVYADPKAINPTYGVPEGDVRQAAINQLGQMSALLLAAGQPMEGRDRAQLLSQIGGTGSQFNTNLYNAAQRRLMTSQMQEKQDETLKIQAMSQKIKDDPEGLQKSLASNGVNVPLEFIKTAPTKSLVDLVSQITLKKATVEPTQAALQAARTQGQAGVGTPSGAVDTGATTAVSTFNVPEQFIQSLDAGTQSVVGQYRTAINNLNTSGNSKGAGELADTLYKLVPGLKEAQTETAKTRAAEIYNKPKAQMALSSYEDQTKLVTNTIDDAINLINKEGRAVVGTAGSRLAGLYEPSTNLKGQLDTIRSAVGTGKIQEMKAQSATGATGFGQLAVKELERIEANIGSLDQAQGPEEIKKRLGIIKDAMNKYNENMKLGYKKTYGEEYKPEVTQPVQQRSLTGGARVISVE
jgi:hypothetical protein